MVGFLTRSGVRVVAGAPVCAADRLGSVVAEFERAAPTGVCYFGAEARLRDRLEGKPGYASVALGAQPMWSAASFVERFRQDPSLRAQRNRAANKGVTVREWPAERAASDPGVRRCLEEWLATRRLPPMHFLVETRTLDVIDGKRIFVAERGNAAVGFVILAPAPARGIWLTEQFVRGSQAPNGTVELSLLTAAEAVAAEADDDLTMGIVPLVHADANAVPSHPLWLGAVTQWARAHGRRFYDFDGLYRFKAKFHPDRWESIHAISHEPAFGVRTLWAILGAFSDRSPLSSIARGVVRSAKIEMARRR